jgi:hypothetical protein
MLFDGTNSVSIADSSDFDFGSGDFTIDFWAYPTQGGTFVINTKDVTATSYSPFSIYSDGTNWTIMMSSNGAAWNIATWNTTAFGTVDVNAWQHIAISRSGNNIRLFKNGVLGNTVNTSSALWTNTEPLRVGTSAYLGNGSYKGYIDEYRLSKGVARWTSNFTPASTPYMQTSVTFGGTQAANVAIPDSSTLVATTPAHASGSVDVVVTNFDGQSATSTGGFQFTPGPSISNISPNSGSTLGGTNVAISGTNFKSTIDSFSKLVLHGDGSGNSFTDSSLAPKTVSVVGNPTQSSTKYKFGGKSAYFTGAAGNYLSVADSEDWNFGSGNFTIDFWANFDDVNAVSSMIGQDEGAGNVPKWATLINYPAANKFTFTRGSGAEYSWDWSPVAGNWYHLALVRNGNTLSFYVNGTKVTGDKDVTGASWPSVSAPLTIGSEGESYGWMHGYLDEIQVSKGIARWTSNFTPLSMPYAKLNVTFGGTPATSITVNNDTSINAVSPAHALGAVDLNVINYDGQTATSTNGFTFSDPAPTISSVTPNSGVVSGGTNVSISGTNFSGGNDSNTSLLLHGDFSGGNFVDSSLSSKTVSSVGGVTQSSAQAKFGNTSIQMNGTNYLTIPTSSTPLNGVSTTWTMEGWFNSSNIETVINSFFDQSDMVQVFGGNGMISGRLRTNSGGGQWFSVGDIPYSFINNTWYHIALVLNGTSLKLYVNGTAIGNVAVAGVPSSSLGETNFKIGASDVYPYGGMEFMLNGYADEVRISSVARWTNNFTPLSIPYTEKPSVIVGGVAATNVEYVDSGNLTATTPAHAAGATDVVVTNYDGQAATLSNGYTFIAAAPTITSITPATGSKNGGDAITITGTGFYGTPNVTLGGTVATSVNVVNANTITAVTPAHITGQVNVVVTNPDTQAATLTNGFTYIEPTPTVASISPISGSTSGGTNVTISGANFIVKNSGGDSGWSIVAGKTLPGNVQVGGQAIIGSNLYIFGGYNGFNLNSIFSAPVTDPTTWTNTGSTLPIATRGLNIAVVGSYVYMFGSMGNSTIYRAPISSPTSWTSTGKTLPGNLGYSGVYNNGTTLYLFGGNNGTTATNVIYSASVSDPTTWTNTGKTLPGNLTSGQFAAIGNNLYLFGGNNGTSAVDVIYTASVSDPTTWTNTGQVLPSTFANSSLAVIGDYIYLLGGNSATYSNNIFKAPISNPTSWSNTGNVIPNSMYGSHVFVVGDKIYLAGGFAAGYATNAIYSTSISHFRPNVYNKPWITDWPTISTDQSNLTIGGISASNISFVNTTTITATAPAHAAGAADVVVTNFDGQSAMLAGGYTYIAPPTITSVSPTIGSNVGGDAITITGTGFYGTPTVTLGGTVATSVNVVNANTITAVTPAHITGQVNVVVTNPDTQAATLTNGFTYIEPAPTVSSISPNNGPVAGGTNVTISGTNFLPKNTGGDSGWTTVAGKVLPAVLNNSSAAVIGDYIYLFGGSNASNTDTNTIYRASVTDPTTWSNTGKTLPGNLGSSSLAVIGSNIYLFGGKNGVNWSNVIYRASVSDPTSWVNTGNTLPGALGNSKLIISGNNMYLVGGYTGVSANTAVNVIYTATTSSPTVWTNTGKTLPANLTNASLIVVKDKAYLLGGYNGSSNVNTIYSASTSDLTTWANTGKTLPVSVRSSHILNIGDNIYLMGGNNGGSNNAIYKASIDDPITWTASANVLPKALTSAQIVLVNNYAYLFGGYDSGAVTDSILRVSVTRNRSNIYNNSWLTNWNTTTVDQTSVTIGGLQATNINVVNSATITAITAPHAAGATDVVVTNYDGQSSTLAGGYTYEVPILVTGLNPSNVSNNQSLSNIQISGQYFQDGATVKFTKASQTDITCSNVVYNDSNTLHCDADFHGALPGTWNVVVTNPNNESNSLTDAIMVNAEISKVKLTTSAQTIKPNAVSNSITIQLQDYAGRATNATGPIDVILSSTSGTGEFSLSKSSWSAVTSVSFLAGENSKTVYYKDLVEGTYTITASENPSQNWTDGSQAITISNNAPFVWPFDVSSDYTYDGAKIAVSDSYATLSDLAAAGSNPEIKNVESASLNYSELTSFAEAYAPDSQGSMKYQLSKDGGLNWYWYNGSSWALTSQGVTQSNTAATINAQISQFVAQTGQLGIGKLAFRAFMVSNGSQVVKLDTISVGYKIYPYRFVFVQEPNNLNETEIGTYTVQSQDQNGNVLAVDHNTTIPLSTSTPTTGSFATNLLEDISTRWDKTSVVIPQGQSSETFYYRDSNKGSKVVTASSAVGESTLAATHNLTVITKYRLLVTGITDPIQAGVPSSVTVQATDYLGNTASDYIGTLHFSSTDAGAQLPGNSVISAPMLGHKTFTNGVTMMTQGEWCVNVTDISDSNITGSQCSITTAAAPSGTPSQLKIITNPQFIAVGEASNPITVQLQDTNGSPVVRGTDTTIYIYKSSLSGQLSTDGSSWNSGAFSFNIPTGSTSANFFYKDLSDGNFTLTASDDSIDGQDFSLTNFSQPISVSIGSAHDYSITSAFTTLPAGTASSLINVALRDMAGNNVATANNLPTYVTSSNGGEFSIDGITWNSSLTTTISTGLNGFDFYYRNTNAGGDSITVSDSNPADGNTGLVDGSKTFSIISAAAYRFAFTNTPTSVIAGQVSNPLTIQMLDIYGNVVTAGANTNVYLYSNNANTLFSNSGPFSPTNYVTISSGQSATSFIFKQTENVQNITLTASDNATTPDAASGIVDASQSETITAGSVSEFHISNGSPYQLISGEESGVLTVQTRNSYGIKIPVSMDTTVYFHSDSSGLKEFSLNASPSWSDVSQAVIANGLDSLNFYYKDSRSGSHIITVGDDAVQGVENGITNAELSVSVASLNPTKLKITSSPLTKEAGESGEITVQMQDLSDNPAAKLTDTVINLSADSGNGRFLDNSDNQVNSIVIPAGSNSATFKYVNDVTGSYGLSVQATGLTFDSQTFTVVTGQPVVIKLSTSQTNLIAGQISPVINAVLYNGHNVRTKTLTPLSLTLYTSTSGKFDLSSNGSFNGSVTSFDIAANSDNGSFYYKDRSKIQADITVSANGFVDGKITFNIAAAPSDHFAFISGSKNITAGSVSEEITLRVYDQYGNETGLQNDTVVNLSSNSSNYQFSLSDVSWNNISSFTASAGQGQISFYYKDFVIGTSTITVSSIMGAVSQNENIIDGNIQPQSPTKVLFQGNAKTLIINTATDFNFYLANDLNQYVLAQSPVDVVLTSNSSTGRFYNAGNSSWETSITLTAAVGETVKTFQYKDSVANNPIITITPNGLMEASQQESVINGQVSKLVIDSVDNANTTDRVAVTVKMQTESGLPASSGTIAEIGLSQNSNGNFYNGATGGTPISSVTFETNESEKVVYFQKTTPGSVTIYADENPSQGWQAAAKTLQIAAQSTHLTFTTVAQSSVAGTQSSQMTVILSDAYGNPKNAESDLQLHLSSGSLFGEFSRLNGGGWASINTLTMSSGSSSVSFYYKDTLAGSQTITVSDVSAPAENPDTGLVNAVQNFTVTPGMAFSFNIISAPQTLEIGQVSNQITVQLRDQFGNTKNAAANFPVYLYSTSSTANFSLSNNFAAQNLVSGAIITAGSSTARFYYRDLTVGNSSITVSDKNVLDNPDQGIVNGMQEFTLISGAVAKLAWEIVPTSLEKGQIGQFILKTTNAYGAEIPVTSDTNVYLSTSSTDGVFAESNGGPWNLTNFVIANGNSRATIYYKDLAVSNVLISASDVSSPAENPDTGLTNAATYMNVVAGSITQLSFVSSQQAIIANHPSAQFEIQSLNKYGIASDATNNATLYLRSSSVTGEFSSDGINWGLNGVTLNAGGHIVNFYYRDSNAGNYTITVADSLPISNDILWTNAQQSIAVAAQEVDHFNVTNISDPQKQGTPSSLVVMPLDAQGYIVKDYAGTLTEIVALDSNGNPENAFLPASGYTFDPQLDHGVKTFTNSVAFYSTGEKSIRVTDQNGITGSQQNITVTAGDNGPVAAIKFVDPIDGYSLAKGATSQMITVQTVDASGNSTNVNLPSGFDIKITSSSDNGEFSLDGNTWQPKDIILNVVQNLNFASFYYRNANTTDEVLTAIDWNNSVDDTNVNNDSLSLSVVAGPAVYLQLTGAVTQTAGSSEALTITARDTDGDIATSYNGIKSITFQGADAALTGEQASCNDRNGNYVNFGSQTELDFNNGVAICQLRLFKQEIAVIKANDSTISTYTIGDYNLNVEVVAASMSEAQSVIDVVPNPQKVGSPVVMRINPFDRYRNAILIGGADVKFSVTGADSILNQNLVFDENAKIYSASYYPSKAGVDYVVASVAGKFLQKDTELPSDGTFHEVIESDQVIPIEETCDFISFDQDNSSSNQTSFKLCLKSGSEIKSDELSKSQSTLIESVKLTAGSEKTSGKIILSSTNQKPSEIDLNSAYADEKQYLPYIYLKTETDLASGNIDKSVLRISVANDWLKSHEIESLVVAFAVEGKTQILVPALSQIKTDSSIYEINISGFNGSFAILGKLATEDIVITDLKPEEPTLVDTVTPVVNQEVVVENEDENQSEVKKVVEDTISKFFNFDSEKVAEVIETATAVSVAVATVSAGAAAASSTPVLLHILGSMRALGAVPYRRKQRWGVVYDCETGKPLANAIVVISGEDGKIKELKNTDNLGFYSFLASGGKYSIEVRKSGYEPVKNLGVLALDTYYDNSYFAGDSIDLGEESIISMNIPMRPVSESRVEKLINRSLISHLVFWIGFAFSGFAMVMSPGYYNGIILVFFIGNFIFTYFVGGGLKVGKVVANDGSAVPFPTVKVFDKATGVLAARTVANEKGSFVLVLNEGEYVLEAESGTKKASKEISLKKRSNVKEKIIFP